jgi:DNA-directed RNA polymerase subunit RPC12/RpoP
MLDPFSAAQKLLMTARCPDCNRQRLELRLHCEMGSGCGYNATCEDCRLEFEVHAGTAPTEIAELLPNLICPECGHKGAVFGMVCQTKTHTCDPVVSCLSCSHIYVTTASAA